MGVVWLCACAVGYLVTFWGVFQWVPGELALLKIRGPESV